MKNGVVLGLWLTGIPHRLRRKHWPVWYWLGAGQRTCAQCLRGGGRAHNLFALVPARATLGAR